MATELSMSQTLTLRGLKKSRLGTILKKVLYPVLPGWVDEGRKIVQGPVLREMLDKVVAQSNELNNVLNAGAGEGLYSYLLTSLPSTKQIIELDYSYSRFVRSIVSPRQRFVAASLAALPLDDHTVDFILCSEVLEHIVEDEKALAELTRVLTPKGWLLISVPTLPAIFDPAHVREGYPTAALVSRLERNGLEVIEVRHCMYAAFQFFLKRYRQGWVPRFVVHLLSRIDHQFPIGKPMDLVILARRV